MNPQTPKPEAVSLLPCPCCASTDLVPPPKHWSDGVVYCKNCDLRGASPTAWNRRAYYAPQTSAGGEANLRETLEACRDTFADYAEMHRQKLSGACKHELPAIHRKIDRNRDMTDLCIAALSTVSPTLPTNALSDDDIVPVSRAILQAAARWIRSHDGDDSNTYRAISLAALCPVEAGDLGPSWRSIAQEAQFLCDRLDSLEWSDDGYEQTSREYFGHVEPSHERLKVMLSAALSPHQTGEV